MIRTSPKLTQVFASRWKALWWAASVCLTAYCTIPSASEKPDASADQAVAMAGSMGFGPAAADSASSGANPWAAGPDTSAGK